VTVSDDDLRLNHEFVTAFETLRKRHGYREMSDAALRDIADQTGVPYATLRTARHLRNAIAHADPVNRRTLTDLYVVLSGIVDESPKMTTLPKAEPVSKPPTRAFRLHAWLDADLEEQMLANGFVSVGGEEIGDLSGIHDPEAIRRITRVTVADRSDRAIALFVGYWRRFLWEAEVGDLVVLPLRDRTVAIGVLVGPYHFVATAEPHARHRRAVSWEAVVPRDDFDPDLVTTLNGQHTVQEFKAPNAVERLRRFCT